MVAKLLLLWCGLFIAMFSALTSAGSIVLTDKQITAVKEPLVQLLQEEDPDAQYGYVRPSAIKNIESLKTALIGLINARMAFENDSSDVLAIQQDLLNALHLSELNEVEAIYGYDLQIVVEKPSIESNLIVVQASFGIPCGEDTLLLAYRFRDKTWHLDLVWKSDPYVMITGAYSDYFDYLVLPVQSNGDQQLVIVHGSPWCAKKWESLIFDVVKLANDNSPQSTLMHRQLITYKGQGLIDLTIVPNGFELQSNVAMLDTDLLTRRGIYRYQVKNDKVIRTQPLAKTPYDFVDEWLVMTEEEIKQFSVKENKTELFNIHARLKDRNGFYGAISYCEKEALYQVEITFNSTKDFDSEELYYFYVKPIKNGYLMHSSETFSNRGCNKIGTIEK